MLAAARVKPALRRRKASSRPRRWGIETMRGADIFDTPANRSCGHQGLKAEQVALVLPRSKPICGSLRYKYSWAESGKGGSHSRPHYGLGVRRTVRSYVSAMP